MNEDKQAETEALGKRRAAFWKRRRHMKIQRQKMNLGHSQATYSPVWLHHSGGGGHKGTMARRELTTPWQATAGSRGPPTPPCTSAASSVRCPHPSICSHGPTVRIPWLNAGQQLRLVTWNSFYLSRAPGCQEQGRAAVPDGSRRRRKKWIDWPTHDSERRGRKNTQQACDLGWGLAELFPVAKKTKHLSAVPLQLGNCREMLPAPGTEGGGMSSLRGELFLFPALRWASEEMGLASGRPGKTGGTGPGPGEQVSSLAC